ncbi:glycosyltransferase family 2 protein [Psychroserpens sp.]|uniref:glycosyltransferase family 2 protein n=1 Tax=Psychroserpens sp. TaxID=2020870 RepID=UPI001B0A17E5|nr:glycosyltransferase family 2 protein [Psychroserpens sp.]MBO6606555.1 glycosyltransferase family 2 protein [Psychroserpens sp.]MBO6631299.1 glycosyltransferase family 2 protein [Psychroserpens sp.]MBO6653259.1 glycosyltransferase family 2 protein [Psychroserpens sp.]MBO6680714.1 glycosyltransferase family 2 protein [Psychroserpens sp.]MBO6750328.1 glycosyltransferase family 2 protein [Psychroserpens sp.]
MPEPLISILTPFKNTEFYLEACLDSILAQSYKHWELIIVDDGSSDNSNNIVQNYAHTDERIKLYQNPGSGIIEALRYAYEKCQGNYITRMDSDDIMVSNRLELMLKDLLHYGKGHIALGQVHYFSDQGINEGYSKYEVWLNSLIAKGSNFSEIYKECVIPSPCWLIHRDDLDLCDGFNPDQYPEDYDLTFRFYQNDIICIPSQHILHHWRDYSTRTSRTHEHYAENSFIDIKLRYFLLIDHDPKRPLTVWGAGQKGKKVAHLLNSANIPFHWICDNPKKIGKHIYDKELHNFEHLKELENPQSIVTVANDMAQTEIRAYFRDQSMHPMIDYFFFC